MYAPLAIKQNPTKNTKRYAHLRSQAHANPANTSGATHPKTGPAHTTNSGLGFGCTSVRENDKGFSTTRRTRPPESNAAAT